MASAPKKRRVTRTVEEKLRGLVNLKISGVNYYLRRDLVTILGISERTLRRFKNQPGYSLAPRTLERIRKSVSSLDNRLKRELDSGFVVKSVPGMVDLGRGKKRTGTIIVKDKSLRIPRGRVLQIPVVYLSKNETSRTIKMNVEGWRTQDKIDFLYSVHDSGRFSSWYAKVDLRQYIEEKLIAEYGDLESAPAEALDRATSSFVTMIGPFAMGWDYSHKEVIREKIRYYDDAGRVVVSISIVEDLK